MFVLSEPPFNKLQLPQETLLDLVHFAGDLPGHGSTKPFQH
ncbi:hypothetical protein ACYQOP_26665 [Methylobacterium sp. CM6247]